MSYRSLKHARFSSSARRFLSGNSSGDGRRKDAPVVDRSVSSTPKQSEPNPGQELQAKRRHSFHEVRDGQLVTIMTLPPDKKTATAELFAATTEEVADQEEIYSDQVVGQDADASPSFGPRSQRRRKEPPLVLYRNLSIRHLLDAPDGEFEDVLVLHAAASS